MLSLSVCITHITLLPHYLTTVSHR